MNCIYRITNLITGKSYIGKTNDLERRITQHIKGDGCKALDAAIAKHGWENFSVEIIQDNIHDDHIDTREKCFITYYSTLHNGYNLTPGGEGGTLPGKQSPNWGRSHTKEWKENQSKRLQGNQNAKGAKHTPEQNQAKSKRMKTIMIGNKNGRKKYKSSPLQTRFI